MVVCVRARVLSRCSRIWLFVTPWTVAHQATPSMGFSRKDTGEGFHALLQGIFLTQGLNPHLLHHRHILYCWATGEASHMEVYIYQVFFRLNYRLCEVLCSQNSSEIRQRGQGKEQGEKFLPHCAVSLLWILPGPMTLISQLNTLQTFLAFLLIFKDRDCSDHQTVK